MSAPRPQSFRTGALILALLLGALLAGGCDEAPFEPFAEEQGDRHYSVFGYLNASADTQWVRVELLRDSLLLGSGEGALEGTRVELEHLGTGRTATLRDSLFAYSGNRETARAHNFWATGAALPIEPLASYRLTVRSPGGAEASAEVAVPDSFPTPVILVAPRPRFDRYECRPSGFLQLMSLSIWGIERLVAVKALYYIRTEVFGTQEEHISIHDFQHLTDTTRRPDGTISVSIDYGRDMCELGPEYPENNRYESFLSRIEVVVAAGNPGWPDYLNLDREAAANPQVASNVEGGVGVFGGVVTDTVTMWCSSCEPEQQDE